MFRAYLELVRPANVATAFADVLAGYAVAGRGHLRVLPWLLGASACLYAGGVVLNDVFDRRVDAVERPERPLPSGRVRVSHAIWLGAALLAAGLVGAIMASVTAAGVATGLAAAILFYDALAKRDAVLGPITMGTCRGLNLLLGMAAVPGALATSWPLSLLTVAYIAGVTVLSRGEVSGGKPGAAIASLLLIVAALLGLLAVALGPNRELTASLAGLVLTALLAGRVLPAFWTAFRHPAPASIRLAVKRGVLSLVLLDAVLAASYAGVGYSVMVVATAVLAGYLARFFAVT